MVKGISCLASNEVVRVRVLVELLASVEAEHGAGSVAASARLAVNQKVWVRLPSSTHSSPPSDLQIRNGHPL